jgi:alpha-L-fucosidase
MKNSRLQIVLLLALAIALSFACRGDSHSKPLVKVAVENDAAHDARMAWWREARFGLFLHWGLFSLPAGAWEESTSHAEWIMTTAQIPVERYELFREQFNPVQFDPDAWAKMAADAGMKYVVITAKHHDGFALFDSKTSDYDVMATPYERDLLRALAAAVRRHGMVMCFYHSIMDWHHPDYLPRRNWESRSAEGADFQRYRKYLNAQVTELLTNYGPIGVMWFDGEWESTWNNEYGKELYALCRKLQPNVIVNNRVSTGRAGMAGMTKGAHFPGDFGTPEQEIPASGLPGVDWETCMTMNDHWGFNAADEHWKSNQDLIRKLCDIASKGGNFLLNVGPTAEGLFPPQAVERLAAIGAWMKVNGEAIHGTQAGPFEALSFGRCTQRLRTTRSGKAGYYWRYREFRRGRCKFKTLYVTNGYRWAYRWKKRCV